MRRWLTTRLVLVTAAVLLLAAVLWALLANVTLEADGAGAGALLV